LSEPYSKSFIYWLSLAQLISWGCLFYAISVLMVPLEQAFGFTRSQSTLGFSIGLLVEGLLAFVVGRLIDHGRERQVMMTGSLLAGIFLFAHSHIEGLKSYYAVWVGLGVAMSASLYSPAFTLITRRFPADYRRAIITLTFLGGLASTVFLPVTAWLEHAYGWQTCLQVLAALQLGICLPIHALILRNAPPVSTASGKVATPWHIVKSKAFILVALFTVLMMGLTAALPAHMVNLLRERGMSLEWAIAIPAAIGVLQVFGRILLYFFEHRFDIHLANRFIPALIPIGIFVLLLGGVNLTAACLFVLLYGMGNGMLTIVKGTAVAQYVSREHVGSLNGLMGFPLALIRAAAPMTLGLLWSPEIGYQYGLILLLMLAVFAIAALIQAQRIRPIH
jgi:predicted MFS family arabinose efflux permease